MEEVVEDDETKREKEELIEDVLSYLTPRDTISTVGKLSYKENLRAWGILQLKKEILSVFPQLKERRSKFGYAMLYNRSTKELKKILDVLEKRDLTPILLLLGRVREE